VLLLAVAAGAAAGADEPAWPAPAASLPDYVERGPEPSLPDPLQPLPGHLVWSDLYESPARAMRLNGNPGTLVCDDADPDPARHCFDPSLVGLVWLNAITPHYSLTPAANVDATLIALDNNKQCDAAGACVSEPAWRALYVAGPRHPTEPLGRPLYMRKRHHGGRSCEERWHPTLPQLRIQVCHDDTIQLLDVRIPEPNQAQVADLALFGYVDLEIGGAQKGQLATEGEIAIPLRATREAPLGGAGTYCLVYSLDRGIQLEHRVTAEEHADWPRCGLEPSGRYLMVYQTSSSSQSPEPGALRSYDATAPGPLVTELQVCEEVSHFCYMVGPAPERRPWAVGRRRFEADCATQPDGPMIRGDLASGDFVEISPDIQASHTSCTSDTWGVNPRVGWVLASQHSHQALVELSVDASQRRKFVGWIRSSRFDSPHPLHGSYFEKTSEPQCTTAGTCKAICATNWGSESQVNSILYDWSGQCPAVRAAVPAVPPGALPIAAALLAAASLWATRRGTRS
jgi:hypothetical protein